MAEQPPLLGDPELGAVGELAQLADVVEQRRRHQQVGVEPRMQLADLAHQRRHGDRVLDQAADIGVVAGAGAGRAAELGGDRLGEEHPLDHLAQRRVVDLARQVLEEALELLGVAIGGGQELGRVELGRLDRAGFPRPRRPAPRGSARPGRETRIASPRSKRAARRSASRNARAGIDPLRSRSSIDR